MGIVDLGIVTAALRYQRDGIDVRYVGPRCGDRFRLPAEWQPIAESRTAERRCLLAMALWCDGFVRLLPRFLARLSVDLHDVRACRFGDEYALVYVAMSGIPEDPYHVWVGRDPRLFASTPRLWQCVPAPVRRFLHGVHPGFTDPDGRSYGVMRPEFMHTAAELAGVPEGLSVLIEDDRISSDRLLRIASDGGALELCVSPDAPGELISVFEGDIDRQPFGPGFDRFLSET